MDFDRGASGRGGDFIITGNLCIDDDLQVSQTRAVVDFDEGKCFGIPPRANPTSDVKEIDGFRAGKNVFDEAAHARTLRRRLVLVKAAASMKRGNGRCGNRRKDRGFGLRRAAGSNRVGLGGNVPHEGEAKPNEKKQGGAADKLGNAHHLFRKLN